MDLRQSRYMFYKGCAIPFFVIALLYIIWLFWNWRQTFYIQEIDMYVRIERIPFNDVKMSFSKAENFGDDYVKYDCSSDVVYMDIYYVPPSSIFVSGASCIQHDKFQIVGYEIKKKHKKRVLGPDAWVPDYYDEYTDSTFIKNPSYHFSIYDYFSGFSLEAPDGKTIYKAGVER